MRDLKRIQTCPEAILSTSKAWKQPIIPGTSHKSGQLYQPTIFTFTELMVSGQVRGQDSPTPNTPPSEQFVTVSGGGGTG